MLYMCVYYYFGFSVISILVNVRYYNSKYSHGDKYYIILYFTSYRRFLILMAFLSENLQTIHRGNFFLQTSHVVLYVLFIHTKSYIWH